MEEDKGMRTEKESGSRKKNEPEFQGCNDFPFCIFLETFNTFKISIHLSHCIYLGQDSENFFGN